MENIPETMKVTEEQVIEALDSVVDTEGAREILAQYAQQCEAEADAKAIENSSVQNISNIVNIECAVKIAQLLLRTQTCKQQGIDALYEARDAALQSPSTEELLLRIQEIIDASGN